MVAYCFLLGWFQMHVNNQWYFKNIGQTSSDGLTENMCQHSAKSKISPTKWCVNIHIQYTHKIYTHKNTYTHVLYTHLTHMIYHVVMEIGLGNKQSKQVYTKGWVTPNSLPEIIVRSLKVGPSKVLGQV
jgi:hypothetical protein